MVKAAPAHVSQNLLFAVKGWLKQLNHPLISPRTKILFICSRNRRRSLTAETVFKSVPVWDVRSAGTEASARIKVTAGLLGWADRVVVMEKRHKERLRQKFPDVFDVSSCICLFIPDHYEFMEVSLVELLLEKMREHFPGIE